MNDFFEVIQREFVYVGYYFTVQLRQIFWYWVLGMVIGSLVSVFAKDAIHKAFDRIRDKKWGIWGVIPASVLGIASPLCMYGTIPIAASFSRHGMRDDWLAAFMMSSVLLNPQLIMYSTALGGAALTIRIVSCFICGIAAGILVHIFYKNKSFFNFEGFAPKASRDTHPNPFLRFLFNLGRNVKATALWFLIGVLLSALFQRYVPAEDFAELFGKSNEGFGVLMAATIGVPLYACGGGTIPLIREWLSMGMSMGSAAAFMITGPATKITNLGALKIVLGLKKFILYIAFVMAFSLVTGLIVNLAILPNCEM
ncbi:MAG: permease [Firmicutes bacterium]|nr:permease [[Eubacterium] siraeum]MCM1488887.1 permease [Bacillota bacterium]